MAGQEPETKRRALRQLEQKSIAALRSAGYRCTTLPSAELFNVLAVNKSDAVLVLVAVNDWPEGDTLKKLRAFPVPRNMRKLVHLWRAYARTPDVKEVT